MKIVRSTSADQHLQLIDWISADIYHFSVVTPGREPESFLLFDQAGAKSANQLIIHIS
ncbi:MAG: hypothetical protein IPI00_18925 [Flavobacteriales bacterium]|nr:hypothetical protein [Flavobacteriales bacterium]MBK6943132.1 hypothetical protein [Flavobacteriales bacterium]MBK7242172.1 hypothetical protein [Flavobacteriales bacterium]MBK7298881.1 hypothetical protein [Flavobacteriales bacterium]MBK9534564.1 hypothetical protein [Flavobacteriales bacterium]